MKWFNNLKVGKKVFIACGIFLLIIAGISANSYKDLKNSDLVFDAFFNDRFMPAVQLNNIKADLLQMRINMIEQEIASGKNRYDEVTKKAEDNKILAVDYKKNLDAYMASEMTEEEKKLADAFTVNAKKAADNRVKFVEALDKRDLVESGKYLELWTAGYQDIKDIINKLVDLQIRVGKEMQAEQNRDAARTQIILAVILLVSLGIGVIITLVLSRSVSGPVNKGLAFANLISEGNFLERIDLDQKDELGQLGKALNKSADNLEKLISEIISSSQNLVRAVEEIASGNENLSQRTSEQASSLEEIAATIEEANASTRQNADNAGEANKLALESSNMAVEGGKIVQDAVLAISEINTSSKKIADIITLINDIAFQTNLLALNAAVEAARAGDQGRGFAVVAGEVRNLAQRAGAAAKEIESLIKDSVNKIEDGTDLVNKSGGALGEIIESVKKVSMIISEIAASSDEQRKGIEQINVAITDMDTMTQQNAALVEETASAGEEMSAQAQELLAMVEKFKIRESALSEISKTGHKEIRLSSVRHAEDSGKSLSIKESKSKSPEKDKPEAKGPGVEEGYEEF